MRHKLTRLCGAFIAAIVLGLLPVALMPAAQAYPDDSCSVFVSSQSAVPGQRITVTGKATTARDWRIEWGRKVFERTGLTFKVTFVVPKVAKSTTIPLHVSSTLANRSATRAGCQQTFDIEIRAGAEKAPQAAPDASDDGGLLPNTGGPMLILLLAGLALLLGGATVVARRRQPAHVHVHRH